MKSRIKIVAALAAFVITGGVVLPATLSPTDNAEAHTGDMSVTATCNTATGEYDFTTTLKISQTGLTGETRWQKGDSNFTGTPKSFDGLSQGPIASTGAGTISLGKFSLPGTTTGKGPWVYAFTKWSDEFSKGSDGQLLTDLDGKCAKPTVPVITEIPYPTLVATVNCGAKNDTVVVDPAWYAVWGKFIGGPWIDTNYKVINGKTVVDGSAQIKKEYRSTYIWAGTAGTTQSDFTRWQMYPGTPAFTHEDVATVCPMNACSTVTDGGTSTNISPNGWTFTETRSQGKNDYVDGGLHVYTFGNAPVSGPDQRKAAGYHAANVPLADIGTPSIVYSSSSGVKPGIQLVLANGRILVGESDSYGDRYWSKTAQAGVPAADGYPASAPLAVWRNALPGIITADIGYSVGSGVLGDVTITSITAGCVTYTFDFIDQPKALADSDVVTDVSCDTELFSTTTTPWTQAYVVREGQYVLGEKVYGDSTTVTREATNAELNEAECEAPEPPVITPTTTVVEKVTCGSPTVEVTTTTTTPAYTYVEADREWVRSEDIVNVVVTQRDKTDIEKALCVIKTVVNNTPLAHTGTDSVPVLVGALAVLLAGIALLAARIRKNRAGLTEV